jgi:hypothetical protein
MPACRGTIVQLETKCSPHGTKFAHEKRGVSFVAFINAV